MVYSPVNCVGGPDCSFDARVRHHLCLLQRRENLPVEEFVPEFAVEAFDVAVLPRTSRLDEQRLDSQPREPFPDGFGDELGPVIRSDVFRDAVPQHQPGQHPQNVPRALLPGHLDRQTLAGELVDHRQDFRGLPSRVRSNTKSYAHTWLPYAGLSLRQAPSLSHSRPRLGCLAGTFSPSRRQIRSTRL